MKIPQSPGYTQRREYTPTHAVPGGGLCPKCGRFANTYCSHAAGDLRIQHRACNCGERFQSIVRRPQ